MKIYRYKTVENRLCLLCHKGNNFFEIMGDLFGEWVTDTQPYDPNQLLQVLPPVDPPNVFAMGLNYMDHAEEVGATPPDHPLVFIKATSSVTASEQPIVLPSAAPDQVDYEGELAIVIGKKAKAVTVEDALKYVLGYTIANDVSARDCQFQIDKQWARAKSFDTFCPLGPCLETELNPDHLSIICRLNGKVMQQSTTDKLIFGCAELVSYLSFQFTLHPGTVILTGTPAGVGYSSRPEVFLRENDVVEVEIEQIGVLKNQVVREAR